MYIYIHNLCIYNTYTPYTYSISTMNILYFFIAQIKLVTIHYFKVMQCDAEKCITNRSENRWQN